MLQREDALLFVVETTAVVTTLDILAARGIDASTIDLRATSDGVVVVEVLGPKSVDREQAVAAGAALAARPETRRAAVMALRRGSAGAARGVFERAVVASWPALAGSRIATSERNAARGLDHDGNRP